MELSEALKWLSSVGAGIVAFWIMARVAFFATLSPEGKRIAAIALSSAIAIAAWGAQVALGYLPVPVGATAWVETIFGVAAVAFMSSQIAHGEKYLSRTSKAKLVE
jgi:hypothetical protein